jgi:pimeloyl-ACP methyl ester carboxylesterase
MTLLTWSLASLAAAYVLTLVGLTVFQRRLQYFPDRRLTDLAQTGMSGGEELRLTTADGETLVAWHFPSKVGRPLILYFHGNAGALVDRVPRFRMFTASGYGVLAVSYRGYGGSTGSPTQSGLMQDGEAACQKDKCRHDCQRNDGRDWAADIVQLPFPPTHVNGGDKLCQMAARKCTSRVKRKGP